MESRRCYACLIPFLFLGSRIYFNIMNQQTKLIKKPILFPVPRAENPLMKEIIFNTKNQNTFFIQNQLFTNNNNS